MGRPEAPVGRGADHAARRAGITAVAVVLAATGLVVSLVAGVASAWPRFGTGPQVQAADPGLAAAGARDGLRGARAPAPVPAPREVRRPSRPPSPPLALAVPSAGIDLPVRPVGVAGDGQMQLPADPAVLGWYRFGPAPAERGSAVLAAHVDSWEHGIGPLARLREVEVGDAVVVRTARGAVPHVVTAVQRYPKQALPSSVFARAGAPRLRLITCGGEFDEAAGHYRENLVVTAEPRR